jgi:alcohol dehydrogenase class IV
MPFEFATATRIVFGPGRIRDAGKLVREIVPGIGHALVVTGADPRRAGPLLAQVEQEGWSYATLAIAGEPTVADAKRGAELAWQERSSIVIAIGGGSAIDAGKAIAALATNTGDVLDYLEVIGRGRPLQSLPLPFVAIPTTAGTGSEVTRNAVLASAEHQVKVSLRSPHMLPRLALVDPELSWSLPPAATAATGLDALTQLIEPFVSSRANPMTDAFCREGIGRAARSLRRAFADGRDAAAREDMSLAALLGGLALANAGLGSAHGFAGPIGGMFPAAPHGAVCAILLPHVMNANYKALSRDCDTSREACPRACPSSSGGAAILERYHEVARMVTGNERATIEDGIEWTRQLVEDLRIPPLAHYGVKPEHVDVLVAKAAAASSMKANPVALSTEELRNVLLAAC